MNRFGIVIGLHLGFLVTCFLLTIRILLVSDWCKPKKRGQGYMGVAGLSFVSTKQHFSLGPPKTITDIHEKGIVKSQKPYKIHINRLLAKNE
jgi:hypothetical protein